jgi:hypothetical protein
VLRRAALIALVALVAGSATAGAASRPALRLLDRSPVTVRGDHFAPRERVRLTVTSDGEVKRVAVRSTANGIFRASLETMTVDRCSMVRVVAVGGEGSHAVLKMLPPPMCMPQ